MLSPDRGIFHSGPFILVLGFGTITKRGARSLSIRQEENFSMKRRYFMHAIFSLLALMFIPSGLVHTAAATSGPQIGSVVNASRDHVTNNEITIAMNPA